MFQISKMPKMSKMFKTPKMPKKKNQNNQNNQVKQENLQYNGTPLRRFNADLGKASNEKDLKIYRNYRFHNFQNFQDCQNIHNIHKFNNSGDVKDFKTRQKEYEYKKKIKLELLKSLHDLNDLKDLKDLKSNIPPTPQIDHKFPRIPRSSSISKCRNINEFWKDQLKFENNKHDKLKNAKEDLAIKEKRSLLFHPISYTSNYKYNNENKNKNKNSVPSLSNSYYYNCNLPVKCSKNIKKINNICSTTRTSKSYYKGSLSRYSKTLIKHMRIDISSFTSNNHYGKIKKNEKTEKTEENEKSKSLKANNKTKMSRNYDIYQKTLQKIITQENEFQKNKTSANLTLNKNPNIKMNSNLNSGKIKNFIDSVSKVSIKLVKEEPTLKIGKIEKMKPSLQKTRKVCKMNYKNQKNKKIFQDSNNIHSIKNLTEDSLVSLRNEFNKALNKYHIVKENLNFSEMKKILIELRLLNLNSQVSNENQLLSDLWEELNFKSRAYIHKSHLLIFLQALLDISDRFLTDHTDHIDHTDLTELTKLTDHTELKDLKDGIERGIENSIPAKKYGILKGNQFLIIKNKYRDFRKHFESFYLNRISNHSNSKTCTKEILDMDHENFGLEDKTRRNSHSMSQRVFKQKVYQLYMKKNKTNTKLNNKQECKDLKCINKRINRNHFNLNLNSTYIINSKGINELNDLKNLNYLNDLNHLNEVSKGFPLYQIKEDIEETIIPSEVIKYDKNKNISKIRNKPLLKSKSKLGLESESESQSQLESKSKSNCSNSISINKYQVVSNSVKKNSENLNNSSAKFLFLNMNKSKAEISSNKNEHENKHKHENEIEDENKRTKKQITQIFLSHCRNHKLKKLNSSNNKIEKEALSKLILTKNMKNFLRQENKTIINPSYPKAIENSEIFPSLHTIVNLDCQN